MPFVEHLPVATPVDFAAVTFSTPSIDPSLDDVKRNLFAKEERQKLDDTRELLAASDKKCVELHATVVRLKSGGGR